MASPNILDQIRSKQATKRKGPVCTIASLLTSVDAKTREGLEAALNDQAIYHSTIAEVLKSHGYVISDQAIGRHRRKACTCDG